MPTLIQKLKRGPVDFDKARDPQTWRNVSNRLLKSAELVWAPLSAAMDIAKLPPAERANLKPKMSDLADHFGAFFVLAGFAVENALKARILERAIAAGTSVPDGNAAISLLPTKGHNLVRVAKKADVPLTPGTTHLLERLSMYVTWAGRYPIPKDPKHAGDERNTRENDLIDVKAFIASL